METIKRYSMKMCDMAKDTTTRSILNRSKSVPKEFLETPARKRLQMVLRVFGVLFFSMTVMALLGILVGLLVPSVLPDGDGSLGFAVVGLFLLNFCNVLGMFAELAGDGGGVNWFAKGFLISIISFGSGFLIFALLSVV